MKIVSCASYYGSGSSAVIDLLSEYNSIKSLGNIEIRFLHDPDGVADLEYNLCENHNRHNSGYAIKRFKRISKFNCGNFIFNRYGSVLCDYKKATKEYVKELVDFEYYGRWFYDFYDFGKIGYYIIQGINHVIKKISNNKYCALMNIKTYCSHPTKEYFYKCTKKYISNIFMQYKDYDYIAVDQLIPSQNISKYYNYFDNNLYVIVVDRDPRDIYILAKLYWKDHVIPSYDVDLFCKWYKYCRESGNEKNTKNSKVVYVHFEDLIYNYENSVKKIENLLKINDKDHINRFNKFNPKESCFNVMLWKKHKELSDDIIIIEKKLEKYLYNFNKNIKENIVGNDISKVKIF